jgi:hypothetical protein
MATSRYSTNKQPIKQATGVKYGIGRGAVSQGAIGHVPGTSAVAAQPSASQQLMTSMRARPGVTIAQSSPAPVGQAVSQGPAPMKAAQSTTGPKQPIMALPGTMKNGGVVKRTGMALVHKGERILTVAQAKNYKPSGKKGK